MALPRGDLTDMSPLVQPVEERKGGGEEEEEVAKPVSDSAPSPSSKPNLSKIETTKELAIDAGGDATAAAGGGDSSSDDELLSPRSHARKESSSPRGKARASFGFTSPPANSKYRLLRNGTRANETLQDIFGFDQWDYTLAHAMLERDQGFWLDIERANVEDMRLLVKLLGVQESTASDILTSSNYEHCEFHENYMVVCMRLTVGYGEGEEGGFVSVVVFPKVVVTVHAEPSEQVRHVMDSVRRSNTPLHSERLLYLILLENLRLWTPVAHMTEDDVESLHDIALQLLSDNKDDVLLRMSSTRARLGLMQRRLSSKRDILRAISANAFPLLGARGHTYLRDTTDHLNDLLRTVALARDSLNQLQSNYLAKISLDLAETDKENNRSMKIFSVIATVGLPVNAISGIGGMNLYYPGRIEQASNTQALIIFIFMKILLAIFLVMLFRYKGLL